MLRSLGIRQMAVIDEAQIEFDRGFNVLTGETGAGKSIITRAIALLCGARASADLLRSDADEALVEGLFECPGEEARVAELGFAPADEVVVRRSVQRNGKSRIWVNGQLASAAQLAALSGRWVHIYGQHEQTELLRSEVHLALLDQFAGLSAERAEMNARYQALRTTWQELHDARARGERVRSQAEFLRFQVHELEQAKVENGEEAELLAERERLRHAERLFRACQTSDEALQSGEWAVTEILARVEHELADAVRLAPELEESASLVRQARTWLEEAAFQLRRFRDRFAADPDRLAQVEERLAWIGRLKRKYGCTADELVERWAAAARELNSLEQQGEHLAALERQLREVTAQAWSAARSLSARRQQAAGELEQRMRQELRHLGMRDAQFQVCFTRSAAGGPQPDRSDGAAGEPFGLSPTGADGVEIFWSANAGEAPRPLARIASGGELSRIMLALKTLVAGDEAVTFLFDEVDAGIGGTTATAVGKRLRALGRTHQVLCITHLPQIAALAHHHLAIEKRKQGGRVVSTARVVQGADRVRELARMLGSVGEETERYARGLLRAAEES